jgi:hypothetical protein
LDRFLLGAGGNEQPTCSDYCQPVSDSQLAMLYAVLSEPSPKEPHAYVGLGLLDGLLAFIGVLIFVWVAQHKK